MTGLMLSVMHGTCIPPQDTLPLIRHLESRPASQGLDKTRHMQAANDAG